MEYRFKLILNVQGTDEVIKISGGIENSDMETLEAFTQYTKELINTKYVQTGMQAALRVSWKQNSPMMVSTKLPPWEDVIVFLHKLRPFLLQSESTYFYRINNLLSKVLDHTYLRSFLTEQRKIYSGKKMQEMIQISSDDVILNSEKVLLDWLNSYEYHRNGEKKHFIDTLHQMFPLEASKVIFLQLLSDKTKAIINLSHLSEVVTGREKNISLRAKVS